VSLLLALSLANPVAAGAPLEDRVEVFTPLLDYADVSETSALEEDTDVGGGAERLEPAVWDVDVTPDEPESLAMPVELPAAMPAVVDQRSGPTTGIPYGEGTQSQGRAHGAADAHALKRRQVLDYDPNGSPPHGDWRRGSTDYREGYTESYEQIVDDRKNVIRGGRIAGGIITGLIVIALL